MFAGNQHEGAFVACAHLEPPSPQAAAFNRNMWVEHFIVKVAGWKKSSCWQCCCSSVLT
jgi:hypothetical protein